MKKRVLRQSKLCATILSLVLAFHSIFAQAQMPEVTVTVFHDLVRFAAPGEAQEMRVEVFSATGEKIFDSSLVAGQIQDWPLHNMQGKAVDSGLYAYTVTVKDQAGILKQIQRGNLLVDREREGMEIAPPINPSEARPAGNIQPQPTGSWDVDHDKNPYVINTPTMGIGTQNPLARLHIGAGTVEPVTKGSTLLLEEGEATSLVLKSTTGGEMFFSQDKNHGLFGTASNHPFGIRTNNQNRLWITNEGNVGIGTTTPGSPLTVAGGIEMTSGGLKFPDGTIQTTAANATGDNPTSNPGNIPKAADQNSAANQNNSSGKKGVRDKTVSPEFSVNEDLIINGNIIFTPPSPQFTRDITMQNNNGGLRFFGAPSLNSSPAAAAIQFWGNNSPFPGQLYLDSGAHDNGAVIVRTAGTLGTITERMRVTATGNVGIGTIAPTFAKLDVRDTDTVVQVRSSMSTLVNGFNNGGAIYFGVDNQNNKNNPTAAIETSWGGGLNPQIGIGVTRDFAGNRTANMLLDYNGNTSIKQGIVSRLFVQGDTGKIGIGTTSPTQLLEVSGNSEPLIKITNTTRTGGPAFLQLGMNEGNQGAFFQASNGQDFKFYNGQYALTIAGTNGNVRIGNTNPGLPLAPSSKLQVDVSASSSPISAMSIDVQSFNTGANAIASHFFRVRDVAGSTTPFYIRGDGNIGIGTPEPVEKLDINGQGTVLTRINSDHNAGVQMVIQNQPEWNFVTRREDGEFGSLNRPLYLDNKRVGVQVMKIDSNRITIGQDIPPLLNPVELNVTGNLVLQSNRTEIAGFDDSVHQTGFHWFGPSPDVDLAFGIKRLGANNYEFHFNGPIFKHGGGISFVEDHPRDSTKEIVYVALEGPENGTYIRGTAQLLNGVAVIDLPEHFRMVTNDVGVTVQLTPRAQGLRLYNAESNARQIIVREENGNNGAFDYFVQGVRKGYENHQVIRDKKR